MRRSNTRLVACRGSTACCDSCLLCPRKRRRCYSSSQPSCTHQTNEEKNTGDAHEQDSPTEPEQEFETPRNEQPPAKVIQRSKDRSPERRRSTTHRCSLPTGNASCQRRMSTTPSCPGSQSTFFYGYEGSLISTGNSCFRDSGRCNSHSTRLNSIQPIKRQGRV